MANEWHFTLNGQPADAPVSAAQLKQLAEAGKLQPTDMVWQEGMTGWAPASSIKGLFPPSKLPPPPAKKDKDGRKSGEFAVVGPAAQAPHGGLIDMNPALALLLTVCTGGLFGLFYAWRVSAAYTARAAVRQTDKAGRTLGRARHPIAVLLLSYLTGGLYFAYWTYRALQECSVYRTGRDCEARSELTLMLIFPPYAAYSALFRLPDLVLAARKAAGVPDFAALSAVPLFVYPCLWPFLPFLAMIYQDALNQVWFTAP
jgi:GYF domain 2